MKVQKPSKESIRAAKRIKHTYLKMLQRYKDEGLVCGFTAKRVIKFLEEEKSVSLLLEMQHLHLLTPNSFMKAILEYYDGTITEEHRKKRKIRLENKEAWEFIRKVDSASEKFKRRVLGGGF